MKRRSILWGLGAAGLAAPARAQGAGDRVSETLLIAGSPAIRDLIAAIGEGFRGGNPRVSTYFETGEAAAALLAAQRGAIDMVASTSDLANEVTDERWHAYLFARSAVLAVCHPGVQPGPLTVGQMRRLASGEIANWREVRGPDLPVRVVHYAAGTPERRRLDEVLLGAAPVRAAVRQVGNATDMVAAVTAEPGSLGFLGPADPLGGTVVLPCGGVAMTRTTVLSGRYPLTASLFLITFGTSSRVGQAFIDYARGPAGQSIVAQKKFVRVR